MKKAMRGAFAPGCRMKLAFDYAVSSIILEARHIKSDHSSSQREETQPKGFPGANHTRIYS